MYLLLFQIYMLTYVTFSAIIHLFSIALKYPGSYPWGYAYPGLESLVYQNKEAEQLLSWAQFCY
jgi:hypothetical protein